MVTQKTYAGLALVALFTGCSSTPDISSTFRVWGHELAHCAYGQFHDETYNPWEMEFNQVRSEFPVRIITHSTMKDLREHHKRVSKKDSDHTKGFMYMDGETCVIVVHEVSGL